MHPVKSEEAIGECAIEPGVKSFSVESLEEVETFERAPSKVPTQIAGVVPFHAGETLGWRFAG